MNRGEESNLEYLGHRGYVLGYRPYVKSWVGDIMLEKPVIAEWSFRRKGRSCTGIPTYVEAHVIAGPNGEALIPFGFINSSRGANSIFVAKKGVVIVAFCCEKGGLILDEKVDIILYRLTSEPVIFDNGNKWRAEVREQTYWGDSRDDAMWCPDFRDAIKTARKKAYGRSLLYRLLSNILSSSSPISYAAKTKKS